jgi:hypothetical protein
MQIIIVRPNGDIYSTIAVFDRASVERCEEVATAVGTELTRQGYKHCRDCNQWSVNDICPDCTPAQDVDNRESSP